MRVGLRVRGLAQRLGAATIPSGPHAGEGGILIAEACEFNRSFHHHRPTLGLITNVEEDHLDIYGSLEAIIEAFRVFASVLPPAEDGGSLLIAHDGAHRGVITPGLQCLVKTWGFHPEADYQVIFDQHACRVGILRDGMWVVHWTTHVPGAHMALNAAAAVILAHNHPSGVAEPSAADRDITHRLADALSLVDVRVLDHLVIAARQTVSFAERGLL